MRADIHAGQEHKRSVQGPDTEAQDLSPPNHHFPLATRGRSIQKCQQPTFSALFNHLIGTREHARKTDNEITRAREAISVTRLCAGPGSKGTRAKATEILN